MIVRHIVDDVDAVLPFYHAIGFKLKERWGPPFAIVKRGALSIWLSGPGTSARRTLEGGGVPAPGGWNRLVLEVKDIDAMMAKLETQGVRFRSRPMKGPGGTQMLIEDPSGNPVELFQPAKSD